MISQKHRHLRKIAMTCLGLATMSLVLTSCTSTRPTVEYYSVNGKNEKQIFRSISRNGPQSGHAIAVAQIGFSLQNVGFREHNGQCRVKNADIKVSANIVLPRWEQRSQADRQLGRAWDRFSAYARWHEKQHVKIADTYAVKMRRALRQIPPEKTCKRLERRISAKFKEIYAEHRRAQLKFDADEQARFRRAAAARKRAQG